MSPELTPEKPFHVEVTPGSESQSLDVTITVLPGIFPGIDRLAEEQESSQAKFSKEN